MKSNPLPGEVWEHSDGSSIYVLARLPRSVLICIGHPPGDSQSEKRWVYSKTFDRIAMRRIRQPEPRA